MASCLRVAIFVMVISSFFIVLVTRLFFDLCDASLNATIELSQSFHGCVFVAVNVFADTDASFLHDGLP
jgi:hypothetical protein